MTQELSANQNENSSEVQLQAPENNDVNKISEACTNCGADLNGPYCHVCGQSSRNMIKYIGEIFQELLDDLLGYDSRLKHTIFPLLFKPAAISLDYIQGRRSFYVLPIRLYLVTSLILMLVLQFNTPSSINIGEDEADQVVSEISNAIEDGGAGNLADDQEQSKIVTLESGNKTQEIASEDGAEGELPSSDKSEQTTEKESKESTEPKGILETYFEEVSDKWKEHKGEPEVILEKIVELLPYMMFILLPVFAGVMKLFYLFSNRYYIEHVILLLHNHCFLYLVIILDIGLSGLENIFKHSENYSSEFGAGVIDWISTILGWWLFIYLVLAMKRFYRQGWWLTILKTGLLSIAYFVMLVFGFAVIAIVGTYQA